MAEKSMVFKGRGVCPGFGEGEAVVAKAPVAISGVGIEVETGTFRWKGHELDGISIAGKVLVMPTGLGYSGGDWALYAMKTIYRSGPQAIVCLRADAFTASGAILGALPLVDGVRGEILEMAEPGDRLRVDAHGGTVELIKVEKAKSPRRERGREAQAVPEMSALSLSDAEKRMLDGEEGEGVRKCMDYLVKLGEAFGARRMLPIASAHPAGCGYTVGGEGAVRFLEWLGQTGAQVRVPATINPACVDHERWETVMSLPERYHQDQRRLDQAFLKLGFVATYSCIPYWTHIAPRFGEHVAWGEHNAVCYANSVLGARTNFEAHATAIPAAVTGRIPEYGLHLVENRKAQTVVRVEASLMEPRDWMCLGLYLGKTLLDRIPVVVGAPRMVSNRQLRDLVTSVGPPFGKIPMVHVAGVTPEAATLKEAFRGRVPKDPETLVVGRREMEEARDMISTGRSAEVGLVTLGCPHCSVQDIRNVARLLDGRKVRERVQLWVFTDMTNKAVSDATGLTQIIEGAGGFLLTDTCAMVCPLEQSGHGFKTVVTEAVKTAGFLARSGRFEVHLGNLKECIDAAVSGRWGA